MIAPVPIAPAFTATPAAAASASPRQSLPVRQSLIARPHTVLGVCEGIGEDLGFNPVYLRVAFAAAMFFAPLQVIAAYLALGVIVAASRWTFPVSDAAPARSVAVEAEAEADYRIAA